MKVGDLVKCDNPSYYHTLRTTPARVGMIVSESSDRYVSMALNRAFRVLWHDGTTENNVWVYDLMLVNES